MAPKKKGATTRSQSARQPVEDNYQSKKATRDEIAELHQIVQQQAKLVRKQGEEARAWEEVNTHWQN